MTTHRAIALASLAFALVAVTPLRVQRASFHLVRIADAIGLEAESALRMPTLRSTTGVRDLSTSEIEPGAVDNAVRLRPFR
jgi:hypothetical protein